MVITPVNLTAVPACGVSCLAAGLSVSSCESTNTTCLCLDQIYNDFVTSCALGNCTIREQLLTQRATSISCDVQYQDQGGSLKAVLAVLFVVQSIFFLLRMVSRMARLASWGWDDTSIALAWSVTVCFLATGLYEDTLGVGRPYWARSFWQLDQTLLIFFTFQVLYIVSLGAIKISICFLYMRIFQHPAFQRVLWATQAFNLGVVLAFFGADFGQCRPLSAFWTSWDGERVGQCYNINAVAYAHSVINIALDVWMLILPATQVWKLNMSRRKKLEVTSMFSFGMVLTAISIVRLTTLDLFAKDPLDIKKSYYTTAVWSFVEVATGIVVACLPATRIVVIKYAGNVLMATGLSRSEPSHLPLHDNKSSGTSSTGRVGGAGGGGGPGGGNPTNNLKLPMPPPVGSSRLRTSIGRELGQQGSVSAMLRTASGSEEQISGRNLFVELQTVASQDEMRISSRELEH